MRPKLEGSPVDIRDYSLISLVVVCVYKLLSKVLANRLKHIHPTIRSPYQGPFVGNRQILDGILMAKELMIPGSGWRV